MVNFLFFNSYLKKDWASEEIFLKIWSGLRGSYPLVRMNISSLSLSKCLCFCVYVWFDGGGLSGRMSTNYGAKSAFITERD